MNGPISYSMLQSIAGANSERIAYIDFKLRFTGIVKRSDLNDEYGLSDASATRLISQYSELRPENLFYERAKKVNVIKGDSYIPLINIDMDTALGMLAHGFNKNKVADNPVLPYSKIGVVPNQISIDSIAKITRAIFNKEAIQCCYISNNSGKHDYRVLLPLAILSDGKSWIFRAYDRSETKHSNFKNFNFSRVADVKVSQDEIQRDYENLSQDVQWNTMIPLALELHPSLTTKEKKTIRQDFGMKPDQNDLILTEKAAFLWILRKQWNIDISSSSDENKNNTFYKFSLKNTDMLSQYL